MTRQEAIDNLRIIYDECLDRFAPDEELEALDMAISVLRGGDTSPSPQETDYNSYMVRCGECRFRKDGVCELTTAEMPDEFYCKDGRKNG